MFALSLYLSHDLQRAVQRVGSIVNDLASVSDRTFVGELECDLLQLARKQFSMRPTADNNSFIFLVLFFCGGVNVVAASVHAVEETPIIVVGDARQCNSVLMEGAAEQIRIGKDVHAVSHCRDLPLANFLGITARASAPRNLRMIVGIAGILLLHTELHQPFPNLYFPRHN